MTATSLGGQVLPAADPLTGVWKLNVGRSKDAKLLPEAEVITIVSQDTSYKLTFDVTQSNGSNLKYDIVTDMKGARVKPINADGRETNDQWRVTRQGTSAFEMEMKKHDLTFTDKYEVSSDGKVMTLYRRVQNNNGRVLGYQEKNGTRRPLPEIIAVFEREPS